MDAVSLEDQALAAADEVLSKLNVTEPKLREAIRAALAIAWIEGRAAGGGEAKAILRRYLEDVTG